MYSASYLSVQLEFEGMNDPQVWVIDFRHGNPDGEYRFSHVFTWTLDPLSGPIESAFLFPDPDCGFSDLLQA